MEKISGWINIYKHYKCDWYDTDEMVFDTYNESQKAIRDDCGYVTTAKIEFYDTTEDKD